MECLNTCVCSRLPNELLLLWSVCDFLNTVSSSAPNQPVRRQYTLETLLAILDGIGDPWCRKLACRFCLRVFRRLTLSATQEASILSLQASCSMSATMQPTTRPLSETMKSPQRSSSRAQVVYESILLRGAVPNVHTQPGEPRPVGKGYPWFQEATVRGG